MAPLCYGFAAMPGLPSTSILSRHLARRARTAVEPRAGERRAAVLVPMIGPDTLLFLVRPTSMPTHAGQVAFPGGGFHAGEDAIAAALRETHEELGIAPTAPVVLGVLDDLRTHTGFVVTPVVAQLPAPILLSPSEREVAATFEAPLARLADPRRIRTARGLRDFRLRFWVDEPYVIWGATGHILAGFLALLDEATRDAETEGPR